MKLLKRIRSRVAAALPTRRTVVDSPEFQRLPSDAQELVLLYTEPYSWVDWLLEGSVFLLTLAVSMTLNVFVLSGRITPLCMLLAAFSIFWARYFRRWRHRRAFMLGTRRKERENQTCRSEGEKSWTTEAIEIPNELDGVIPVRMAESIKVRALTKCVRNRFALNAPWYYVFALVDKKPRKSEPGQVEVLTASLRRAEKSDSVSLLLNAPSRPDDIQSFVSCASQKAVHEARHSKEDGFFELELDAQDSEWIPGALQRSFDEAGSRLRRPRVLLMPLPENWWGRAEEA